MAAARRIDPAVRDPAASTILAASGYEQLVALASGAVACLVGFALAGSWPPFVALALSGAVLAAAVAVRPAFLGRPLQRLLARRGIELPLLLRGRLLALVVAVNALGWLATGAATWTLVAALTSDEMPGPRLAGSGVRARVDARVRRAPLPGRPGPSRRHARRLPRDSTRGGRVATGLALALRLANTLGELVAIGLSELVHLALRRGRTGARPRPAE